MAIARKISAAMHGSSWIRKMFEEGAQLKAKHGDKNVFDFSIGNPNLPPPQQFSATLRDTVDSCGPGAHCYMSQVGYPHACEAVADHLCKEQQVPVSAEEVILTCGAAGALNVILKTLLDPGDEVILTKPVFVDYRAYVDNHAGVAKVVDCKPDFMLDLDAIAAAVNEKTKAVIINSPNNPSGQIYSRQYIHGLGRLLASRSSAHGRTIYLLSDEPYRKIVFDGHQVPSIFKAYAESIIATSYSKDLSIPGERIGFAAVNPAAKHRRDIMAGMTLATRILGFINAPALMQRVIADLQGVSVDVDAYSRKRDLLCRGLADAGYEFNRSPGTFYLFPKSPIEDDVAFVKALHKELILTVPGQGFLFPGYFRIAFCVDDDTIVNALPGFKRVMEKYSKQ
jgi:aspartate aminotransferase